MTEPNPLEAYRKQINDLDVQIMSLLADRLNVCRKVGVYKLEKGLTVLQPDRIEQVKARNAARGVNAGLRETFTRALYGLIIDEACSLEDDILEGKGDG